MTTQRPFKCPPGVKVTFSRTNNAFIVAWNTQVLRVITKRDDVCEYLRSIGGAV